MLDSYFWLTSLQSPCLSITILFVELSKTNPDSFLFSAGGVGTTINTFSDGFATSIYDIFLKVKWNPWLSNLLGLLGHGIKQSVETETNLTSVERLVHFAKLTSEKDKVSSIVKQVTTKDFKPMMEPDSQGTKTGSDKIDELDFNGDLKEDYASTTQSLLVFLN